jgi:hypothetical protein
MIHFSHELYISYSAVFLTSRKIFTFLPKEGVLRTAISPKITSSSTELEPANLGSSCKNDNQEITEGDVKYYKGIHMK